MFNNLFIGKNQKNKEVKKMKRILILMVAAMFVISMAGTASATAFADIAFLIDQSGSMGGEFAWLGTSITGIDTAITAGGVTANYGVAGYEYDAGSAYAGNAWLDLPSTAAQVTAEVASVSLYGGTERGYHAADWSANNFSWTGGDYAKVLVLITDEPNDFRSSYAYGALTGEPALAQMIADNNILLNVVTFPNYYQYWDSASVGLYDLTYLKDNPIGFTNDFVAAKLREIQGVPEPATLILLGSGIAGLAFARRRKKS